MKNRKSATPNASALLVMDVQSGIVTNIAKSNPALIKHIKKAIAIAHKNNLPVIYVMVTFRDGFPEVSANNKSFSLIKQNSTLFADKNAREIYPEVSPGPQDIVVVKRRVSAFSGSDLEVVLRSQQINHLVLCGIATSGVVLSTVREAADKDYQLTVLSDGSADSDEEVQRVLLTKVFPRQADVMTVAEWGKILEK